MSRAKPKKGYSLSFSETNPVRLSEKTFALLRDDLNLDPRREAGRCEAFRAAVSQKLSTYCAWMNFLGDKPSMREQMAELRQLRRKLQDTLNGLLALSPLARDRLTHAYADAGITNPPRIDEFSRCIDCAIGDLAALVGALELTQATWRKNPRGRPPEPIHVLTRDLASLFAEYDVDKHADETAQRSARDAFLRHALKAISVRSPKRFDDILSEK